MTVYPVQPKTYFHSFIPPTASQALREMCIRDSKKTFRIILTQGLNRQIRRMCAYLGYQVEVLKRIRIMNLTIDGLQPGAYRELLPCERKKLEQMLKYSSNETVTGGHYGNSPASNERTGQKTQPGRKGLLLSLIHILKGIEPPHMVPETTALSTELQVHLFL